MASTFDPSKVAEYQNYTKGMSPDEIAAAAKAAGFSAGDVDSIFGAGTSAKYGYSGPSISAPAPTPASTPSTQTGSSPFVAPNYNFDPVAAFGKAMDSKDYAGAVNIAKQNGYNNDQISTWINANKQWGIDTQHALDYLNGANKTPTTPTSLLNPLNTKSPDPNTGLLPGTVYNQQKQFDAQGRVNIGTIAEPNYVDPLQASGLLTPKSTFMTRDEYLAKVKPDSTPPDTSKYLAGNTDYNNFIKAFSANTPQIAQINGDRSIDSQSLLSPIRSQDLSQNQLAEITKSDSPLMQLASESGKRLAANRGLLNSSMAAGAAQSEMVKAAQPFALQDAQASNQERLANQQVLLDSAKSNQAANLDADKFNTTNKVNAQMLGYQTGLDAAKASVLSDRDYINKANLAATGNQLDIDKQYATSAMQAELDANKAGLQGKNDLNQAMLGFAGNNIKGANDSYTNALTTTNTTAGTVATQNNASGNTIKEQNNASKNTINEQNNKAALEQILAGINNSAQLEQVVQQGRNSMATTIANNAANKELEQLKATNQENLQKLKDTSANAADYVKNVMAVGQTMLQQNVGWDKIAQWFDYASSANSNSGLPSDFGSKAVGIMYTNNGDMTVKNTPSTGLPFDISTPQKITAADTAFNTYMNNITDGDREDKGTYPARLNTFKNAMNSGLYNIKTPEQLRADAEKFGLNESDTRQILAAHNITLA